VTPTDDQLWAAVAEPTRRRLLDLLLAHGPATATELAERLPITRQAIAKHLAVLDDAGLVRSRREGRELRWSVHRDGLALAQRSVARAAAEWDERLSALKRLGEGGGD
jgi:ArsR family transcriptional regulator, cadmium/lead-responsive transcriptional repressor